MKWQKAEAKWLAKGLKNIASWRQGQWIILSNQDIFLERNNAVEFFKSNSFMLWAQQTQLHSRPREVLGILGPRAKAEIKLCLCVAHSGWRKYAERTL